MKKLQIAVAALVLAAPAAAFAGAGGQTCATAQELMAGSTYSGDTSTYGNPIGAFGPLPSPGPDAIYKFTSDGMATGSITVTASSFNSGIFLLTTCAGDSGTPLEAATGPTVPYSMPVDNGAGAPLNAGTTYYVVVSGNPADSSGPSGTFSFDTPT
ncbi:MAG: hypothetical protein WBW61_07415, partial [Rhodanobacteraceae bacterium]